MSSGTRMTATGMSIGSPHYMSPEQARGKEVDGRSDLYSLGVVLYEMLTGRVPFDAADTLAVAYSHVNDPVPELPRELVEWRPVMDRLLAKSPEDRYGSAGELADVLASDALPQASATRVMRPGGGAGAPAPAREPATRFAALQNPQRKRLAAVAGGVLLALVAVGIGSVALREGAGPERESTDGGRGSVEVVRAPVRTPSSNSTNPFAVEDREPERAAPELDGESGQLEQARRPNERPLNPGDRFSECEACPLMVVVPAGTFMMGSPPEEEDREETEGPQHRVTIAEPFAVGMFEVTFAEWNACVSDGGCNGYRPKDLTWGQPARPVINVNWEDARAYADWLSATTGGEYRLLSESEWEYAARAGTQTAYYSGPTITTDLANFDGDQTAPVGSYSSNGFGLHDMHGNVQEWVEDCWNADYRGAPSDGTAWTVGDCTQRVLRGGSWFFSAGVARSASRAAWPAERDEDQGFRVARSDLDIVGTICPDARCMAVNAAKVDHSVLDLRDARRLAEAIMASFVELARPSGEEIDAAELAELTNTLAGEFALGRGDFLSEGFEQAAEQGFQRVMTEMLESGLPLLHENLESSLYDAWRDGRDQIVDALMDVGVYGRSRGLLSAAAVAGDEDMVDALLAAGVYPGDYELLRVAESGRVDMVEKLVAAREEFGRDRIDFRYRELSDRFLEPFREAVRDGDARVVEALLLAGAQPRETDLEEAMSLNHGAIVELLARALGTATGNR